MGGGLHASSAISTKDGERFRETLKISFSLRAAPGRLELLVGIKALSIGHHLPTGDLFRQLRITASDRAGKEVLHHNIGLDVDTNTFRTKSDTRLKVRNRQSIQEVLVLIPRAKPERCAAEFIFEGKIDHLHAAGGDADRRILLYEGSCGDLQNNKAMPAL